MGAKSLYKALVSVAKLHAMMATNSYWVCEKSDGVRVLMFIHTNLETKAQAVYIVRLL